MSSTRGSGLRRHNESQSERKRRRRASTSPAVGRRSRPSLEALETRQLLSTFCRDQHERFRWRHRLRQALRARCARPSSTPSDTSPDDIVFDIPASTACQCSLGTLPMVPEASILAPRPGRSSLPAPLPAITNTVSIDGYTEAHASACRFAIRAQSRRPCRTISVTGSPTGGTFTLTTAAPFRRRNRPPFRTTPRRPRFRRLWEPSSEISNIDGHGRPLAGHSIDDHVPERYARASDSRSGRKRQAA